MKLETKRRVRGGWEWRLVANTGDVIEKSNIAYVLKGEAVRAGRHAMLALDEDWMEHFPKSRRRGRMAELWQRLTRRKDDKQV